MAKQNIFRAFDWKVINTYLSPRAMNDLNAFLEKLPQNAGHNILIMAGIAWISVAGLGLFTMMKAQQLNNLRAQLQDAKALKPIVPVIRDTPVEAKEITDFAKKMADTYRGLDIKSGSNMIEISGTSTAAFNLFREAILHTLSGGSGWKINMENICLGRECKQKQLFISMKINRIVVDKPESKSISYLPMSSSKPNPGASSEKE